MIILFISMEIGNLGVGREESSIKNSLLAGIVTVDGMANPILVLVTVAVNVVLTPAMTISPSIGRSLKLLKPCGNVTNT